MHSRAHTWRWLARTAVALAVVAGPLPSAWALVKCVASDGKVTFQDVLCDMHSTSVAVRGRFGQYQSDPAAAQPIQGAQQLVGQGRGESQAGAGPSFSSRSPMPGGRPGQGITLR